jgi:acyl-CoA thioester hydrolase
LARPDPRLLDPAAYPVRLELMTRFQDMDPNRHLNNVATSALLEDLRVRFDWSIRMPETMQRLGLRTMIVSLAVEYIGEMFYPAPVVGHIGALAVGRTSWSMASLLTQEGRTGAFSRATLVCVGPDGPTPLPDEFRRMIEGSALHLYGAVA